MKLKRYHKILLGIVLFLMILRISLPCVVLDYLNGVIADIPGYEGKIEDIDISLLRGAYVVKGFYLKRTDAGSNVPFLKFPVSDISIEWRSVWKGKIVSEVILNSPELIYVFEDQKNSNTPDPDAEDWTKAITKAVPIEINHFKINNGKIAFVQLQADPNIDLHFSKVNLNVTNMRNVINDNKELPSKLNGSAVSIGGGKVSIEGALDIIKEIPDLDVDFSLKNANATALNDLTNYYSGIDFSEGQFELYSEAVVKNGYLKGYIKPLLKDTKFLGKEDSFLNSLWEGFVGFFKFILKNHKKNTLATKIPIEGELSEAGTKFWPSFFGIFKNAWFKAFENEVDDSVKFNQVEENK